MDGLSALPWTARWCQGTLPCPQSVDKRCRRSHGRVERLAMDGPLVSRYLTLSCRLDLLTCSTDKVDPHRSKHDREAPVSLNVSVSMPVGHSGIGWPCWV